VFVHDVERLQPPAVLGLVELVVQRPHVIGVLGGQPVGRTGGGAQPLAFVAPDRHPQAFLAPEPLDGLAVHAPALLMPVGVDAAVAPARMDPAELAELLAQRLVPVGLAGLVALGGAVLADDLAGQPLGDAQHALRRLLELAGVAIAA